MLDKMAIGKVFVLTLLFLQLGNGFGQDFGASGGKAIASIANQLQSFVDNSSMIQQAMDLMRDPTAFLTNMTSSAQFLGMLSKLKDITDDVSGNCLADMMTFAQALYRRDQWALRMIDAMGKPPAGLMGYKLLWMGDWDECINTVATISKNDSGVVTESNQFSGQYCTVTFPLKIAAFGQNMGGTIGTCFPDSCTSADAKAMAKLLYDMLPPEVTAYITEPKAECKAKKLELDGRAIGVIVVCVLFAVIITLATVYDVIYVQWLAKKSPPPKTDPIETEVESGLKTENVYIVETTAVMEKGALENGVKSYGASNAEPVKTSQPNGPPKYKPGIVEGVLLSFSAFTNGTKLLNTNQPKGALTAVNGIRFLSMTWVIIGHGFGTALSPPTNNMMGYASILKRWEFTPIANGTFSVDTFFVLSGLLVSYLSLKEMKKVKGVKGFKWVMFYFHRFWRLTPPYMLLLMVWVSLDRYISNGPLWSQDGFDTDSCKDVWWTNLLYINNLVKGKQMMSCFGWTWYLANDMQFYILSPLLIIPLYYSPILGGLACLAGIAGSALASGLISMHYKLPSSVLFATTVGEAYMWQYYVKPWCRVGPYIVGIFAGYMLYRCNLKTKINKIVNFIAWIVAAVVACLIIYGLFSEDVKDPLTIKEAALYNATSRIAWGACIAWVIYSCAVGYGGPVNHILSWSAFVPLGRLTYFAYLVHLPLMSIYSASAFSTITLYDYAAVYQILGHIVMSYAAAFVLSLAFEAPMMGLEKVLLGRGKHS